MFKKQNEGGLFCIGPHSEAAKLTYLGLYAQQHKGKQNTGISSSDDKRIVSRCGTGIVREVFSEQKIQELRGNFAIGQISYSRHEDTEENDRHPFTFRSSKGPFSIVFNGCLHNGNELREQLSLEGSIFQGDSDAELIGHLIAKSRASDIAQATQGVLSVITGAYAFMVLLTDDILLIRDPLGYRPLAYAKKENLNGALCTVVASETCSFDLIEATYVGEVPCGLVVRLKSLFPIPLLNNTQHCSFEVASLARPDSWVYGHPTIELRERLGKALAQEYPLSADYVIPMSDSSVPAAITYAEIRGIKFRQGITRNHYLPPIDGSAAVPLRYNPSRWLIEDKDIILIINYIFRGKSCKKMVELLRNRKPHSIKVLVTCPPHIQTCQNGVDIPPREELLAVTNRTEEIRKFIQADSFGHLSLSAYCTALEHPDKYCIACFQ